MNRLLDLWSNRNLPSLASSHGPCFPFSNSRTATLIPLPPFNLLHHHNLDSNIEPERENTSTSRRNISLPNPLHAPICSCKRAYLAFLQIMKCDSYSTRTRVGFPYFLSSLFISSPSTICSALVSVYSRLRFLDSHIHPSAGRRGPVLGP